jgi:WD40 repeat protein
LLAAPQSRAQSFTGDLFGKNQVQYRRFDWRVLETEHFYIHYYSIERRAAHDAGRMAERDYARLSRILGHEFREKKPVILFASRSDFGQNNVTGDLGEGTGGVTEPFRHRMLLPFTGDYRSFEHVLTHEMVHEFQYDVFARGHAGAGIGVLAAVNPPLWFVEGQAEYLSIGPWDPHTSTVIRDAAINGRLPTIRDLTERPDEYFPYRYGESLWAYVGKRWGDETIGNILNATPSLGVERAVKRETGLTLDELGTEWKEAMQAEHLPQLPHLQRMHTIGTPLLNEKRTGGEVFIAPSLSPDGNRIAFLSNGSFLRGQVFIDLWLGDARTGKRERRLVKSTTSTDFEELQLLYSQSSFSPDGRLLAFTALRKGRDVIYIEDVEHGSIVRRIDLPVEVAASPSWSPDGTRLVFCGTTGGISDLYVVDANGKNVQQLTNDPYGDAMPQWSPDGRTIAFVSDRAPESDLDQLHLVRWRLSLYNLEDGHIETIPGQDGLNINPMWSPDGRSIAYVSNRTGIENLFLYDLDTKEHYQLSNLVGGVSGITEYSPAISWARESDRLAVTYFENDKYTIWMVDNPRQLKKEPFHPATGPTLVASTDTARQSTTAAAQVAAGEVTAESGSGSSPAAAGIAAPSPSEPSTVLGPGAQHHPTSESHASQPMPGGEQQSSQHRPVTVAELLDSASLALPDTTKFKEFPYRTKFAPDFVARPTLGYARDNFGSGVYGGTAIVLSDLLGDKHLAFSAAINGRIGEAQLFAAYANFSRRLQFFTGAYQEPYYFGQGAYNAPTNNPDVSHYTEVITRYIQRQAFVVAGLPLNRFSRFEGGLRFTHLDRTYQFLGSDIDGTGAQLTPFAVDSTVHTRSLWYQQPYLAYVSDNVLWGIFAPISGRRYRFQVQPTLGTLHWMDFIADYRRYDPILFNYLTLATRFLGRVSYGRDADSLQKYIAYTDYLPGYERTSFYATELRCPLESSAQFARCSPLIGSKLLVANAELRFPLLRRASLAGVVPLPPVEGAVYYNAGLTWFDGQTVVFSRRAQDDYLTTRSLLTSYGIGLRVNLFNYIVLRWDYAKAMDVPPPHNWRWYFSLYPPF